MRDIDAPVRDPRTETVSPTPHSLEPEDLAALTMEASALAMVPLAGTQHTVGRPDMTRY